MYENDAYPSEDETMTRTFHFPRPFVTSKIMIDQLEGARYKLFKVRYQHRFAVFPGKTWNFVPTNFVKIFDLIEFLEIN